MPHDFWQYLAILALGLYTLVSWVARRLDLSDLARLAERVASLEQLVEVRRCRVCNCTDDEACWSGCWWVEDDLCSSCDDGRDASASSLEAGGR